MQKVRDAAGWHDKDNPIVKPGSRAERLARNGATQCWERKRPPPMYVPARTKPEDRADVYSRYESDWNAGVVRAAPLQNADQLMKVYGCVISPAFLLRKPGKKPRPCINYRPTINRFTKGAKMKMETLKHVPEWGSPKMWMWQADKEKAFNSIATAEMQPYMVVDIGEPPDTMGPHLPRFLVPLGMNFGYKLAPYLYFILSKPWLQHVRHEGCAASLYVDDSIGGHPVKSVAIAQYKIAVNLADYYGHVLAPDKGSAQLIADGLCPVSQHVLHLGLNVVTETENGLFVVPYAKELRVESVSTALLLEAHTHKRFVSSTSLETYVGYMGSLAVAEPQAYYRCRNLQICMAQAGVYSRKGQNRGRRIGVKLDRKALAELEWGTQFRKHHNSRTMWRAPLTRVIATDASGSRRYAEVNGHYVPPQNESLYPQDPGWGAVLLPLSGHQLTLDEQAKVLKGLGQYEPMKWPNLRTCCGIWSTWEQEQMISFLELRGLRLAVQFFSRELQNSTFLAWQDNMNVVSVVSKLYSKSPMLHDELGLFMKELSALNAKCILRWVESAKNPSDYWSRVMYGSDWSLTREAYTWTCNSLGAWPTVDRFAQPHDHQVDRFNCPYEYPSSEATDAFTQCWEGEVNWVNAPWALTGKVLQKLRSERGAAAIVLLPSFETMWTPLLRELSVASVELPWAPADCVTAGRLALSVHRTPEPLRNPSWRLRAHLILPRRAVQSSLSTITEQEDDSARDSSGRQDDTSRSPRKDRAGSRKPSGPGNSRRSSGPSSWRAHSAGTTRKCTTGTPTTRPQATTRMKCATPRFSVLVAGSPPEVRTGISIAGPVASTATSTSCLAVVRSTRIESPSTRRSSRGSSWSAPCHSSQLARSNQPRPEWRYLPLDLRSSRTTVRMCATATTNSAGFSSCLSRCSSFFGPRLCGRSSREMCAVYRYPAGSQSCASAGRLNAGLSCSRRRIGARLSCTTTIATRHLDVLQRRSYGCSTCDGTGAAKCLEKLRFKRMARQCSLAGCERPLETTSGCRQGGDCRATLYASWGRPPRRLPGAISIGSGCGACGRLLCKSTHTSKMITATASMLPRCSVSASRAAAERITFVGEIPHRSASLSSLPPRVRGLRDGSPGGRADTECRAGQRVATAESHTQVRVSNTVLTTTSASVEYRCCQGRQLLGPGSSGGWWQLSSSINRTGIAIKKKVEGEPLPLPTLGQQEQVLHFRPTQVPLQRLGGAGGTVPLLPPECDSGDTARILRAARPAEAVRAGAFSTAIYASVQHALALSAPRGVYSWPLGQARCGDLLYDPLSHECSLHSNDFTAAPASIHCEELVESSSELPCIAGGSISEAGRFVYINFVCRRGLDAVCTGRGPLVQTRDVSLRTCK